MSRLCFLLDSQSNRTVVISTLCHYLSSYVCVLSTQLHSRLIEEKVFFSCYPCVTNSAHGGLRPHPIPWHSKSTTSEKHRYTENSVIEKLGDFYFFWVKNFASINKRKSMLCSHLLSLNKSSDSLHNVCGAQMSQNVNSPIGSGTIPGWG